MLVVLLNCVVLLSGSALAGEPDLVAHLAEFNALAEIPLPALSVEQQAKLVGGGVVRFIEPRPDDTLRVVGLALLTAPRDDLFIASQHPRYASSASSMLTEKVLSADGDRGVWYGFIDLPRPFTDRHYVINNWNNHLLAATSDGAYWEHLWQLHPDGMQPARAALEAGEIPGVDAAMFDDAIAVPTSMGGVVFLDVGDGETLVAYHSVFDPGGALPERPMAELVKRSLEDYFAQLKVCALESVPRDYRAGMTPLIGADGEVIPLKE
ncbi:MAG: hypothetical protein ACI8RZ_003713 [Myxococcota bacterium]|jgi:hypothetical protein